MSTVVDAAQAALAAEHAAVYGYGVVGGRITASREAEARQAYDAHRSRRDSLIRTLTDLGAQPVAAAPGYELPFPVTDSPDALKLAAFLEDRVADTYGDLVRAATASLRQDAAAALRDAAVRAVRWTNTSRPFPGLTERS